MTIGARTAVLMTISAIVAIGFAALALRSTLHAYLGAYTSEFDMMRSMMHSAPNLSQIYDKIDRTFVTALAFALVLAIIARITLGGMLGRSFHAVNDGLNSFAKGLLDEPIPESGPPEMRRLARNANAMACRLAASRAAERELVAGVVHDLAHPITALRATIEAARDGLIDVRDLSTTSRMLEAVATLQATTEDLRDVAEWKMGTLLLHYTDFGIPTLARRIAEMYGDFATRRGVTLRAESEPLAVHSDLQRLQRLVDNLVVNAIQATPAGGVVSFTGRLNDGIATLTVRDEAGDLGRTRLHAALERGEGIGLGLQVVHTMAAALGARLEIASSTGGSAVRVSIQCTPLPTKASESTVH